MKYIGIKVLLSAVLMSRAEYCEIRGWDLPEDENKEDEVYLVEYAPTGDNGPNVEGYEGYVSMSPKAVFEAAYVEFNVEALPTCKFNEPYKQRVVAELEELTKKFNSLGAFVKTSIFEGLPPEEQNDLALQRKAMFLYRCLLVKRVKSWLPKEG